MTVRIPPDNLIDKIISIFGGKREIVMPKTDIGKPYVSIKARKEGVFEYILRIIRF